MLCEFAEWVHRGCTLGYGPNMGEATRTMARQLDRVLRGTPVGTLPMEHPKLFRLAINAQAAGAIGVPVPAALRLQADEVIE